MVHITPSALSLNHLPSTLTMLSALSVETVVVAATKTVTAVITILKRIQPKASFIFEYLIKYQYQYRGVN